MPSFPVASSYGRCRGPSTNSGSATVVSNPEHPCCSGLAAEVAERHCDSTESRLDGRLHGIYRCIGRAITLLSRYERPSPIATGSSLNPPPSEESHGLTNRVSLAKIPCALLRLPLSDRNRETQSPG